MCYEEECIEDILWSEYQDNPPKKKESYSKSKEKKGIGSSCDKKNKCRGDLICHKNECMTGESYLEDLRAQPIPSSCEGHVGCPYGYHCVEEKCVTTAEYLKQG